MKKNSKLKILLIVLLIILLSMIGFFGIYVKDQNRMSNIIPEYKLGMDLTGYRLLQLDVSKEKNEVIKDKDGNVVEDASEEDIKNNGYIKEEVSVNKEEVLNSETYKEAKKILEERLKKNKFSDYMIRQDEQTGSINIYLKEDENTDSIINLLTSNGLFQIIDSQTQEVLMDNSNIKTAKVMYSKGSSNQTIVYLSIILDKEGKAKLEEISKVYVSEQDEEGNETGNKVKLVLDDQTLIESSFDEPITTGEIQLSLGNGRADNNSLDKYIDQASSMAALLKTKNMPITYEVSGNKFIKVEDMTNDLKVGVIAVAAITIVLFIYLIIRYHAKGIFAAVSHIGFVALLLLVLRYTNVPITIDGMFSLLLCMLINYSMLEMMLRRMKKEKSFKVAKDQINKLVGLIMIPLYIIAIIFTFITYTPINTFGMTLFWGITTILVYNFIVTGPLFKQLNDKTNTEEA